VARRDGPSGRSPNFILVEFAGAPGVGKSTLKAEVQRRLPDVLTERDVTRDMRRHFSATRWFLVVLYLLVLTVAARRSGVLRDKSVTWRRRRILRWALMAACMTSPTPLMRGGVLLLDEVGPVQFVYRHTAYARDGQKILRLRWFQRVVRIPDLIVDVHCEEDLRRRRVNARRAAKKKAQRTGQKHSAFGDEAERLHRVRQSAILWFMDRGAETLRLNSEIDAEKAVDPLIERMLAQRVRLQMTADRPQSTA
jgi:hypothetical protein